MSESTRTAYWSDIKTMAQEIMEEAIETDPQDPEQGTDLHAHIHEAVDGCGWIIYTRDALKVMEYSPNDDAHEDLGEIPTGQGWSGIVTYCAFHAMRADLSEAVQEQIDAYEPPDDEDEDEDDEDRLDAARYALEALGLSEGDEFTVERNTYSGRGMNGRTSAFSISVRLEYSGHDDVKIAMRALDLESDNLGKGYVFYTR
jgi:hypothetical protein